MKKITIYLIFSALVVAFAVLNIAITNNDSSGIDLKVGKIEAAASNPEWGGIPNLLRGQGLWKDERSESAPCPTETGWSIRLEAGYKGILGALEINRRQQNPPTRYDIRCYRGGRSNCSPVKC